MLHRVIKKEIFIFQTADHFFENSSNCHILRYWAITDEFIPLFWFIALVIFFWGISNSLWETGYWTCWSGLIPFLHWTETYCYNLHPRTHVCRAKPRHTFKFKSHGTNRTFFSYSWSFVNLEVKWKQWLSVISNDIPPRSRLNAAQPCSGHRV